MKAKNNNGHLKSIFKSRRLRTTSQRLAIAEEFLRVKGHINTEEFYLRIKKKFPSIGYATVYRTLKILKQSGIAAETDFGEGAKRYERWGIRTGHHDHILCLKCGRIEEFTEPRIEALQDKIAKKHGFKIMTHKLQLFGHCRKCIERGRENA